MKGPGRSTWLLRLSVLHLVAVLLLWALERFVGERYWLTALLVYLPQAPFAVPSLVLLPWAVIRRQRAAVALNLAAGVACAFLLLHVAVPVGPLLGTSGPGAFSREGRRLRVVTFNVWLGKAGVPGIIATLRRARPDVVCLQEATAGRGTVDPVPALRRAFPGWYAERQGEYFIAARYPIRRARRLYLGSPGVRGYRRMLEVVVDVAGRPVTLYNVHFSTGLRPETLFHRSSSLADYLAHTAAVRRAQAAALVRHAAASPGPTLIVGDFNSPPGSEALRRLAPRFADSFARAGWGLGYTYPAHRPLLRIDYVLVSPEFVVRRCSVLPAGGSDHRAVVADLAF